MSSAWRWFLLSAAIMAADQLSKWAVLDYFAGREPRQELTGFLNLVLVCNKGAAFSFLANAPGWQTPLFIAFALGAAGLCGALIVRNPGKRLFCAGLALVVGGALGNVIDRLRFGCVVDYLDFYILDRWPHWPAFNVADSAITIGAVLLILDGFAHHEKRARAPS
ncbi:MAG TPA: signal peptidase II [Burkholderiales bacterium]|jgi:signal peptidase II|nr:signal peptidase II [Burkholderiales bacterium]HSA69758.1 signal peptidase II [Burkholderiales bacterium]